VRSGVCLSTGLCGETGCADGTREGFTGAGSVAACSGGWSVPGVKSAGSLVPACGRKSGDDSANPTGAGCSVEDLCAPGWHVCESAAEVAASAGVANACTTASYDATTFFVTRQSGSGSANCNATGVNDLFGCGNLGTPPNSSCSPLNRFSNDGCGALGVPWSCGGSSNQEAFNVTKTDPAKGGAMCCRKPAG
jgi:hypothetical protein